MNLSDSTIPPTNLPTIPPTNPPTNPPTIPPTNPPTIPPTIQPPVITVNLTATKSMTFDKGETPTEMLAIIHANYVFSDPESNHRLMPMFKRIQGDNRDGGQFCNSFLLTAQPICKK